MPTPRVVVVTRSTSYEALLERHATRGQAQFFLETRGEDIGAVEVQHRRFQRALGLVLQSIPSKWRRAQVDRRDLDRFLFEPEEAQGAHRLDHLHGSDHGLDQFLLEQHAGIEPQPGDGLL